MAERRALVNINGQIQETPTGDTIYGGGSSFPLTGFDYIEITASYTTLLTDSIINVTSNSPTVTMVLSPSSGFYQEIINTGLGIVIIQSSGLIEGESSLWIDSGDAVTLVNVGSNNWKIK